LDIIPSPLRDSLAWVRRLQPIASSDASTPNRLEMTNGDPDTLLGYPVVPKQLDLISIHCLKGHATDAPEMTK